ncbi:4'-phosphopantetheinyl transferase family protein [Cyanobium sp. ATX 6F1]|uniref:4'-phosphopantetheinyl transferase family protein n=1 Tax=Cyanobium sp. ATX 6F1 TaxID=2823702 RepID=UPI0020CCA0BF|nr:4'-phosphopantetheinyl transferase superfamily protein [Cyanobium sp. ATX 6F1]MCP9917397.1 4'-phosphopantetheinyl transferase superfamily protein [Cyanobium sp. ATX 6F1]
MNLRPRLWLRSFRGGPDPSAQLSLQERDWCARLPAGVGGRYGASRALLRQQLSQHLGCEPLAVPLHSPPGAATLLAPGWGSISLAHSGDRLLIGWSPRPIGVDLEDGQRRLQAAALAARFFPLQERRQLEALEPAQLRRAVLESWVHKEAAIKWSGGSLAADLRHWCWDHRLRTLLDLRGSAAPPCRCEQRQGWLCAAVGEGLESADWG